MPRGGTRLRPRRARRARRRGLDGAAACRAPSRPYARLPMPSQRHTRAVAGADARLLPAVGREPRRPALFAPRDSTPGLTPVPLSAAGAISGRGIHRDYLRARRRLGIRAHSASEPPAEGVTGGHASDPASSATARPTPTRRSETPKPGHPHRLRVQKSLGSTPPSRLQPRWRPGRLGQGASQ